MKNEDVFKKEVDDGAHIRYEINEDHFTILSKLSKLYKAYFNRDQKEFRYAKDILYYKGGWPSENTPPKAQSLANHIADAYMILSFLGKEEDINFYLSERGLKIMPLNEESYHGRYLLSDIDYVLDEKREKSVKELWFDLFGIAIPAEPKEVLDTMMNLAIEKQKTICELADKIKIEKGELVQETCDVKVPFYLKAVNISCKKLKGDDINNELDKMEDSMEQTKICIDFFDTAN